MLAELLSAAIRDEVPPLDERQATSEAVPASRCVFGDCPLGGSLFAVIAWAGAVYVTAGIAIEGLGRP